MMMGEDDNALSIRRANGEGVKLSLEEL